MTLLTPVRTIICSPWAGDHQRHRRYAQACMWDSLHRGEAPFLSHLLYTQVLMDAIADERTLGLACEGAWLEVAQHLVLYVDLGVSKGMVHTLRQWTARGVVLGTTLHEVRTLGAPWSGWDKPNSTPVELPAVVSPAGA